jgi:DNA repair protein RecO (recombination protein O)
MADIRADGILLAQLPHGENNAIVRLLTRDHGLLAGYVRGARGSRMRPLLMAGNQLHGHWRSRTESQLGSLTLELARSRGLLALGPRPPAVALDWVRRLPARSPALSGYP